MATDTDLKLVIANFARTEFEQKVDEHQMPSELQNIILEFSRMIVGCDLLTMKEDLDFVNILSTKINISQNNPFTILYKASENDYSKDVFHDLCDGKAPTITIIESNAGNIFGGYTSKEWTSDGLWIDDEHAFLFQIKSINKTEQKDCPRIFNIRTHKIEHAIRGTRERGPIFGRGWDISIGSNCGAVLTPNVCYNTTYCSYTNWSELFSSYDWDGVNLAGTGIEYKGYGSGQRFFQVIDYYVIKIN